jgi:hypothetical protein
VVHRLFELCAAGWGFTRLAKQLNAEHVPPPRPGGTSWAPSAIRKSLLREDYRGLVRWNCTQKVHRGGRKVSGRRRTWWRPTSAQRIVSDEPGGARPSWPASPSLAWQRAWDAGARAPRSVPYVPSGPGRCDAARDDAMSRHHGAGGGTSTAAPLTRSAGAMSVATISTSRRPSRQAVLEAVPPGTAHGRRRRRRPRRRQDTEHHRAERRRAPRTGAPSRPRP